jgi:hypothetical protein
MPQCCKQAYIVASSAAPPSLVLTLCALCRPQRTPAAAPFMRAPPTACASSPRAPPGRWTAHASVASAQAVSRLPCVQSAATSARQRLLRHSCCPARRHEVLQLEQGGRLRWIVIIVIFVVVVVVHEYQFAQ